jgi:hypothetical protein
LGRIGLSEIIDNSLSEEINSSLNAVSANSQTIENIVQKIIKDSCEELDGYVDYVHSIIADENNEIPTTLLEDMTLVLPTLLYRVSTMSEKIGIREDISKALKQEIYNNILEEPGGKSTEKKIRAELDTQSENLTLIIYQRAYKTIKAKMDYGIEILQSVKKILSRRIAELEVSKSSKF